MIARINAHRLREDLSATWVVEQYVVATCVVRRLLQQLQTPVVVERGQFLVFHVLVRRHRDGNEHVGEDPRLSLIGWGRGHVTGSGVGAQDGYRSLGLDLA